MTDIFNKVALHVSEYMIIIAWLENHFQISISCARPEEVKTSSVQTDTEERLDHTFKIINLTQN